MPTEHRDLISGLPGLMQKASLADPHGMMIKNAG
jgi:hypothetical protein